MNEEKFWNLIESCVKKEQNVGSSSVIEHYNKISAALALLSQPELNEFVSIFYRIREQTRNL
ncbi:MAG: hypothetical protein QG574_3854 [Cyanobacteriota bacterium erpe_2018_sw_21hr_WHONDRS-SW48-000092_B_bin.40]|jgi:hypothetical protein|nr:hypothetical protein [Cyanobacteriota bacterium erpe_2018_sw_21hr_WHONDRS-SW48-000092_B_bin.40]